MGNLRKQQLIIVTQNVQFLLLILHGLHVTSFILLNFHQTMLRWLMLKGLRTIVMNRLISMMAMINIPICVNNLSLSINRRNQSIVLRLLLTSHIKLLRSRKRKDTCLVLLHVLPFLISFELLYLLILGLLFGWKSWRSCFLTISFNFTTFFFKLILLIFAKK